MFAFSKWLFGKKKKSTNIDLIDVVSAPQFDIPALLCRLLIKAFVAPSAASDLRPLRLLDMI